VGSMLSLAKVNGGRDTKFHRAAIRVERTRVTE
jgi:hypothetical protein